MYCVTRYVNWYVIARKNTTRNRKTSTLRVTLLKKSEGVGRIVTVVTAVTKESWVCFGLNWNTLCRQAASCFPYALWISKSLLWHWLPAIQISGLSKLIYIPLLKVLSVLDVYSWYSDLSFRRSVSIWCHCRMSWQFGFFFFLFRGGAYCEQCVHL